MKYLFLGASMVALTACVHVTAKDVDVELDRDTPVAAYDYSGVFAADANRPVGDYENFNLRKSEAVLEFSGVKPGMTVVELEAGDGFYTELLATVAGDTGKIYQQNPAQFDSFLGDSVEKRGHLTRYSNIEYTKSPFDELAVADGEADIVTWFLGPHELWFVPKGEEMGLFGGTESTFAEIARVLKPGGTFVALDHSAPAGAPATTGGDTHRIDKAIVIDMASAAGLTLVDESDVLANPEDDLTINVFDPAVRRKTDRFLLKFEK